VGGGGVDEGEVSKIQHSKLHQPSGDGDNKHKYHALFCVLFQTLHLDLGLLVEYTFILELH
jgi:hypothetical protein